MTEKFRYHAQNISSNDLRANNIPDRYLKVANVKFETGEGSFLARHIWRGMFQSPYIRLDSITPSLKVHNAVMSTIRLNTCGKYSGRTIQNEKGDGFLDCLILGVPFLFRRQRIITNLFDEVYEKRFENARISEVIYDVPQSIVVPSWLAQDT